MTNNAQTNPATPGSGYPRRSLHLRGSVGFAVKHCRRIPLGDHRERIIQAEPRKN